MTRSIAMILAAGLAAALLVPGTEVTGGETAKKFAADKGAKTIDVSKYPKGMQEVYADTFTKRCGKCHTLARPINTDFTPTKWEGYVKKMMRKPGSGLDEDEAKGIWEFLVFDTKQRKAKFWGKLPDKEKAVGDRVDKAVKDS